jgi:hypothetical protein
MQHRLVTRTTMTGNVVVTCPCGYEYRVMSRGVRPDMTRVKDDHLTRTGVAI